MEKNQSGESKNIKKLIEELKTFDDQLLEVFFTQDGGATLSKINLVGKFNNKCVLFCDPDLES